MLAEAMQMLARLRGTQDALFGLLEKNGARKIAFHIDEHGPSLLKLRQKYRDSHRTEVRMRQCRWHLGRSCCAGQIRLAITNVATHQRARAPSVGEKIQVVASGRTINWTIAEIIKDHTTTRAGIDCFTSG
jgi:hypothetical protein